MKPSKLRAACEVLRSRGGQVKMSEIRAACEVLQSEPTIRAFVKWVRALALTYVALPALLKALDAHWFHGDPLVDCLGRAGIEVDE